MAGQNEFTKGEPQHEYAVRRFLALLRTPSFTFSIRNDGVHIWITCPGLNGALGGPRDKAEHLIEMIRSIDKDRPVDMPPDVTDRNIESLITAIQKSITQ